MKFIPEQLHRSCRFGTVCYNERKFAYNEVVSQTAVDINAELKKKRKQIGMADLFIAATAMANNLPLVTLNKKHFDRIVGLTLID